jgi:hypothetical protein
VTQKSKFVMFSEMLLMVGCLVVLLAFTLMLFGLFTP